MDPTIDQLLDAMDIDPVPRTDPRPIWQDMDPESRMRVVGYRAGSAEFIREDDSPRQRLGMAIRLYGYALVNRGYQAPSRFILGKDPESSRYAARILAALEEMREDGIPPGVWLDWLAAADRKMGKAKPIPIFVALTVGLYRKRRGWFRKERQADFGKDPVYHPEDVRIRQEQLLRNNEARDAWQGGYRAGTRRAYFEAWQHSGTAWYAAKRLREVEAGAADPMERFPRLPERERGRGR